MALVGVVVVVHALAAPFSKPLVRRRALAALGVAGCGLLSVPLGAPVGAIARALHSGDAAAAAARLAPDVAGTAGFAVAVAVACPVLWRRRE